MLGPRCLFYSRLVLGRRRQFAQLLGPLPHQEIFCVVGVGYVLCNSYAFAGNPRLLVNRALQGLFACLPLPVRLVLEHLQVDELRAEFALLELRLRLNLLLGFRRNHELGLPEGLLQIRGRSGQGPILRRKLDSRCLLLGNRWMGCSLVCLSFLEAC